MPTVDATVGGVAANSYQTVAEADNYFAERLHSAAWTGAAQDEKEAALIQSARLMDSRVCWAGSPVTSEQARAWPRSGLLTRGFPQPVDTIPAPVRWAQAELAMALLTSDVSVESDIALQNITRIKAGPVELGFGTSTEFRELPVQVLKMLEPSWLCGEEDVALPEPILVAL